MSSTEYAELSRIIYQTTGISLQDDRAELLRNRIIPRLKALGLTDFKSYCRYLCETDSEGQHLIDAVTTNVTSFFREPHQFEHVEAEALQKVEADNRTERRIRIWSAGCSSGQEPYSIGMTLLDSRPHLGQWDVRILATDINATVLHQADSARYQFETPPEGLLSRWLISEGENWYRVDHRVRDLVWLRKLNLLHEWPMRQAYDLVLCRNVTIYFDRETQQRVLNKIVDLVRVGGYLYLGHAESLHGHTNRFCKEAPGSYRKIR